jgi:hypothetical protein
LFGVHAELQWYKILPADAEGNVIGERHVGMCIRSNLESAIASYDESSKGLFVFISHEEYLAL